MSDGEGDPKVVSMSQFRAKQGLQNSPKPLASSADRSDDSESRIKRNQQAADSFKLRQQATALTLQAKGEAEAFLRTNGEDIRAEIDAARSTHDKELVIKSPLSFKKSKNDSKLAKYFGGADSASMAGIARLNVLKNWVGNTYAEVEGDEWPIVSADFPDTMISIKWVRKDSKLPPGLA